MVFVFSLFHSGWQHPQVIMAEPLVADKGYLKFIDVAGKPRLSWADHFYSLGEDCSPASVPAPVVFPTDPLASQAVRVIAHKQW